LVLKRVPPPRVAILRYAQQRLDRHAPSGVVRPDVLAILRTRAS
jgi:hypothetical protein